MFVLAAKFLVKELNASNIQWHFSEAEDLKVSTSGIERGLGCDSKRQAINIVARRIDITNIDVLLPQMKENCSEKDQY